jgi:CYTH domain-containing protein
MYFNISQDMSIEIERKFIVHQLPTIPSDSAHKITQVYAFVHNSASLRFRISKNVGDGTVKNTMTFKDGAGLVRTEEETLLETDTVLMRLLRMGNPNTRKTRYLFGPWEIAAFDGAQQGLVIAEIEFSSTENTELPELPEGLILGPEVTEDERYGNVWLALNKMIPGQLV